MAVLRERILIGTVDPATRSTSAPEAERAVRWGACATLHSTMPVLGSGTWDRRVSCALRELRTQGRWVWRWTEMVGVMLWVCCSCRERDVWVSCAVLTASPCCCLAIGSYERMTRRRFAGFRGTRFCWGLRVDGGRNSLVCYVVTGVKAFRLSSLNMV